MGRILPTLIQQLAETESMLAGFRPTLRKSDQYILGGLFAAARRYAAAISQADALLAMQLEQAKEIEVLRQELEQFRKRNV